MASDDRGGAMSGDVGAIETLHTLGTTTDQWLLDRAASLARQTGDE